MPKIKNIPASSEYVAAVTNTQEHRERNDCMVKALTILTGLPYATVHAALTAAGRKQGEGTYWDTTFAAVDALGFKLEALPYKELREIIQTYPGAHKGLQNITTRHPVRFAKQWANMDALMFDCRSHVAAFKDGQLHDWSRNRAMQVKRLLRLVKKEEAMPKNPNAAYQREQDNPGYNNPELMGHFDYARGHTACPYGDKDAASRWRSGYKAAAQESEA